MENNSVKKEAKNTKPSVYAAIRVRKETAKLIRNELTKLNNKKFGKKVKADDLVAIALPLIGEQERKNLQDATLSGKDEFALLHQNYCDKNGTISKNDFLSKLVRGEIILDNEIVTLRPAPNK